MLVLFIHAFSLLFAKQCSRQGGDCKGGLNEATEAPDIKELAF